MGKKTDIKSLSQYIAQAGVCSRRKAAELIKSGQVIVNDTSITEPGLKVSSQDVIRVNGKVIISEEKVYVLINKPKNVITTAADEKGRKTVLDLIGPKVKERIYPVGRLDRNTTGLLLITNDGELSQRLSHPKYEVQKEYVVSLDKRLNRRDADKILKGVVLEDGEVRADDLYYIEQTGKKKIGIILHSGKNRIIRRLFEHMGYQVKSLDRVRINMLSKKGLRLGEWRYLTEDEVKKIKK